MKKVTAFVASGRKGHTYTAVVKFLDHLQSMGDIETEIVRLHDYRLEFCRGCKLCFVKGEEYCPLKDDRDVLIEKMMASDGVVFATPNYEFQLAAILKAFLDRLGYSFHRPRFFGKTFTSIVTQGIGLGGKILDYLDFNARCLGFNTVKGTCFTALEPMTEVEAQKLDKIVARHAQRYYAALEKSAYPQPSFLMLIGFRLGRTGIRLECAEDTPDYRYYVERGWLESAYFYPIRLNPVKAIAGKISDAMAVRKHKARYA